MFNTQAMTLHIAGIQLLKRASSEQKVKDVDTLVRLGMDLLAESRSISESNSNSNLQDFLVDYIGHDNDLDVALADLRQKYLDYCKVNHLVPVEDFDKMIDQVFVVNHDRVDLLALSE